MNHGKQHCRVILQRVPKGVFAEDTVFSSIVFPIFATKSHPHVLVGKSRFVRPVHRHLPSGDHRADQLECTVYRGAGSHEESRGLPHRGHPRQLARERLHLLDRTHRQVEMDREMVQGQARKAGTTERKSGSLRHLARPPCLGAYRRRLDHPRIRLL